MVKSFVFILLFTLNSAFSADSTFEKDARQISSSIKKNLMGQLKEKMSKEGPLGAVEFCHVKALPLTKEAGQKLSKKYSYGRTSHKVRNQKNLPPKWTKSYLDKFKGKAKQDIKDKFIVHQHSDGKKSYLEALFIAPLCLSCHGEKLSPGLEKKLNALYPADKAKGFKAGEFRGFIWVSEK